MKHALAPCAEHLNYIPSLAVGSTQRVKLRDTHKVSHGDRESHGERVGIIALLSL